MYKDKYEILRKSKEAIGHSFGEIDNYGRISNSNNKGNLGQIIEESFFEYSVNSNSEPDFKEAGVELKVTPVKINKNGTRSAKERLVLNVIDFNKEVQYSFENSSFWRKNKVLLLMFYLHDFDIMKKDMEIFETLLFEYPTHDLEIIKNDYKIIQDKIKEGKAHEISEADTMYLSACTKGANSNSVRTQPFSPIMAKSRAFSLKQSYMTSIVRQYVMGSKENEKIIKNVSDLKEMNFEEYLIKILKPYYGKTTEELRLLFDLNTEAKNKRSLLINKMLKVKNITKSDEFIKSGIKFKTILLNKNGKNKESMSFPHFDFIRLSQETWEESELKAMFESTKFLFAVFQEKEGGEVVFDRMVFYTVPEDLIETEIYKAWHDTKEVLLSGNIIKGTRTNKNGRVSILNNFPKQKSSKVIHVRPHGRNADDKLPLPVFDKLTGVESFCKQGFWFNNLFVREIINRK